MNITESRNYLLVEALAFPAILLAANFYYPYCTRGPIVCLLYRIFGVHCPGCGITRAICHLARGAFREAVHYNILAIPVLVLAFLLSLKATIRLFNQTIEREYQGH